MHGDFIWYELMTSDADAARDFYTKVFRWQIGPSEGEPGYAMITASEGEVGGLLTLSPEMQQHGARPVWLGYVHAANVDEAVTSIEHGGGKRTMGPVDIPQGRFAMVTDPQGAPFYVMAPQPPAGREDQESLAFSYDQKRVGHCAWNELMTSDPAAAWQFYGSRFGWVKDGEMDMGPLGKYEFVKHTGRAKDDVMGSGMVGAIMPMMPGAPAPAWAHYFRVADIDAAVEAVKANGGQIVQGPDEIPGGDFSLKGVDPQGAIFALVGSRQA
jgi:predicted enzyme related to lactoylglutathione lyase